MANAKRSAEPVAARPTAGDPARQLDAALRPHGYQCLHRCRVPGSRTATIDHVVIGPSGVWLIDDKRISAAISVNKRGEVLSGRTPLTPEIDAGAAKARTVDRALGVATRAMLAVDGAAVPGGMLNSDDVLVVLADAVGVVIRKAPLRLAPADVDKIMAAARVVLAPKPVAPLRVVPDEPTDKASKPEKKNEKSRPRRRVRRVVLLVAVACVAVGTARWALADDPTEATDGPAIDITFECRTPGLGWTALAAWSGLGDVWTASWSSSPDGPWAPAVSYGSSAAIDGVAPSARSYVRLEGQTATGVVRSATAPDASC